MSRSRRSNDWGFPRWRAYDGGGRAASTMRRCDRHGCEAPGTCPAPKAPDSPERWWFCETHAAEYNRDWDYFARMTAADADRARAEAHRGSRAYEQARHWGWSGPGDGNRSRAEMDALALFDLPPDADATAVKAAYRRVAKESHPDLNPGDRQAAERFRAAQAAYRVLSEAEARRRPAEGDDPPAD